MLRMEVKETTIDKIEQDGMNLNKHSEYGMSLIDKSLSRFGCGRSILLDKEDRIIAGNGIHEAAMQLGLTKVLVVESDGDTLVAVKRNDIDLDTKEGREFALADNATAAANLQWDTDNIRKVREDFDIDEKAWGVHEKNIMQKVFDEEKDTEPEIIEYPITILRNREEYLKFMKIRDSLKMNAMAAFGHIMDYYYDNNF